MHVFIDDQIFVAQEQGGISRYFTELARELGRRGVRVRLFAGITRNQYVPTLKGAVGVTTRYLPRRDHLRVNTWTARFSRFWRRWDFTQLRRQEPGLIYHASQYGVDPWIARRAEITCLTVFDMIAELLCDPPSRRRSLELKRRGVPRADGFFCISARTELDFLKFFPECERRTRIIHLAASLPSAASQDLDAVAAHTPYLLLVGDRSGYKNGLVAIQAYRTLASQHPRLNLLCIGGGPLRTEERALLEPTGLAERVLTLRGSDQFLAACYAKASALLYPSRYEGFGLPVLEAMQARCPVITTPCGSLPEVAGEAALYIEPDDVSGFASAADRLLRDEAWRQKWVRAGQERAAGFTWSRTALQTQEAYAEWVRAPCSPSPN